MAPREGGTVTFTQISEDDHGDCQHFLKLYDGLLTACWTLLWNGMKPIKTHYFNCNVADLEGYSLNLIVVGVHLQHHEVWSGCFAKCCTYLKRNGIKKTMFSAVKLGLFDEENTFLELQVCIYPP